MEKADVAWCPGCGNFPILKALKEALAELQIDPTQLVMVSGIGQAAKIPHYVRAHVFNGLHGRALPPATAIKAANPRLTVIAESGDGDMYGEGGNHFIHCIRRNPDITNIVHDNRVYGLTKGQASPTSPRGFKTSVQVHGVALEPFNPLAVAIALDASFVARANAQDREQTKDLMKKAITHKGYALLDILQPCVTYNKLNTYQWFKEHTYYLDESHNPCDRMAAFQKSLETDKLPLGVFYVSRNKPSFEETTGVYREDPRPLYEREVDVEKLRGLMNSFAMNI
ncbi:MAG TPA: thiamine pyrophosphate-dependent enzyme [Sedimentisphaerales bacterium]|nr:thiamine pyrophosphate-dependent enzyme [Sedimentisphaerales bacterium]